MDLNQVDNKKLTQEDWVKRWQFSAALLDESERQNFFKRIYGMADSADFIHSVSDFLCEKARHDPLEMKEHLQEVAQDKAYLEKMSTTSAYFLGVTYYDILNMHVEQGAGPENAREDKGAAVEQAESEEQKILGSEEANAMASYLGSMRYPDKMYQKVAVQSMVITILADVLQFDRGITEKNWDVTTPQDKQEFLTKISTASDYIMTRIKANPKKDIENIYNEKTRPKVNPVLVDVDDTLQGKWGVYYRTKDQIIVSPNLNYVSTLKTLQHEKAHQMSHMEYKKALIVQKNNLQLEHYIQQDQAYILEMFKENADEKSRRKVYLQQPEERFARSAENFVSASVVEPHTREAYLARMKGIFCDAPEKFDYIRESLEVMSFDVMSQKLKAKQNPAP